MKHTITIRNGDTGTHQLDLSDGGKTDAKSLERIEWLIGEPSNVYSFRIEKKEHSPDVFIFFEKPPKTHTRKGTGLISVGQGNKIYTYSIHWKTSETSEEYHHDPIISIKPSGFFFKLIKILIILFGISILFRPKKKKSK